MTYAIQVVCSDFSPVNYSLHMVTNRSSTSLKTGRNLVTRTVYKQDAIWRQGQSINRTQSSDKDSL